MVQHPSFRILLITSVLGTGLAAAESAPTARELEWARENPDAVRQLGEMPAADRAKLFDLYQRLDEGEKKQLLDGSRELEGLTAEERRWALDNPDAVRELAAMGDDDREKLRTITESLSPEERRQLLENADELRQLSPAEKQWALDNPDAVRELGKVAPADRERLLETYRALPPDLQDRVRGMGARP